MAGVLASGLAAVLYSSRGALSDWWENYEKEQAKEEAVKRAEEEKQQEQDRQEQEKIAALAREKHELIQQCGDANREMDQDFSAEIKPKEQQDLITIGLDKGYAHFNRNFCDSKIQVDPQGDAKSFSKRPVAYIPQGDETMPQVQFPVRSAGVFTALGDFCNTELHNLTAHVQTKLKESEKYPAYSATWGVYNLPGMRKFVGWCKDLNQTPPLTTAETHPILAAAVRKVSLQLQSDIALFETNLDAAQERWKVSELDLPLGNFTTVNPPLLLIETALKVDRDAVGFFSGKEEYSALGEIKYGRIGDCMSFYYFKDKEGKTFLFTTGDQDFGFWDVRGDLKDKVESKSEYNDQVTGTPYVNIGERNTFFDDIDQSHVVAINELKSWSAVMKGKGGVTITFSDCRNGTISYTDLSGKMVNVRISNKNPRNPPLVKRKKFDKEEQVFDDKVYPLPAITVEEL